jgi:hypothetical protein
MSVLASPTAFDQVLPLELQLYELLVASVSESNNQIQLAPTGIDPTIRAPFLRWFLTDAVPSAQLSITRIQIDRATIIGVLDLEAVNIHLLLRFINCTFNDKVILSDSSVAGLDLEGGIATAFMADRLVVHGSLRMRAPAAGGDGPKLSFVRLCGAEIHGNLDMRGCILVAAADANDEPVPLFADGLIVRGNVLLSNRFRSAGEIRLNGCHIHRNLDCSGAALINPGGYSLSAAGAHIEGSAYFCETQEWVTYKDRVPFSSEGTLRLEGAVIEGDLDCDGGTFVAAAFLPRAAKRRVVRDRS